jgi:hypothetical protein
MINELLKNTKMIQVLKNVTVFVIVMMVIKYVWTKIYDGLVRLKINYTGIWNDYFVDVKIYYANKFRQIPNIYFLGNIDVTKVYEHIRAIYTEDIVDIKQHSYYDREADEGLFNCTIVELKNKRMLELANDHLFVYHSKGQQGWVNQLVENLKKFTIEKEVNEVERKDIVKVVGG